MDVTVSLLKSTLLTQLVFEQEQAWDKTMEKDAYSL